jgi:hypothetical protein
MESYDVWFDKGIWFCAPSDAKDGNDRAEGPTLLLAVAAYAAKFAEPWGQWPDEGAAPTIYEEGVR